MVCIWLCQTYQAVSINLGELQCFFWKREQSVMRKFKKSKIKKAKVKLKAAKTAVGKAKAKLKKLEVGRAKAKNCKS
jgi:hypothetical protein